MLELSNPNFVVCHRMIDRITFKEIKTKQAIRFERDTE